MARLLYILGFRVLRATHVSEQDVRVCNTVASDFCGPAKFQQEMCVLPAIKKTKIKSRFLFLFCFCRGCNYICTRLNKTCKMPMTKNQM